MIERGQGGSIINVSSISGLRPQPQGLLYSFTKAGLIMMTRSWAREFVARHPGERPRPRPDPDRLQRILGRRESRQSFLNEQPIARLANPKTSPAWPSSSHPKKPPSSPARSS